jgi:cell division protease FtsH
VRRAAYLAGRLLAVVGWAVGLGLVAAPLLWVAYRHNLLLDWWVVLGGDPAVPPELREPLLRAGVPPAPRFDVWAALRALPVALLGPAATLAFSTALVTVPMLALLWWLSRGRTQVVYPGDGDVGFADVRGQPEAVASAREALALFRGRARFRGLGGSPPHGILLEGPPGTGKTLLGRALATTAGVPFVYASGTSFANMYLGVGNLRIARLFRVARRLARAWGGAVLFIDELDAVGGSRGLPAARPASGQGPPGVELAGAAAPAGAVNALHVNELLVQMDGISLPGAARRRVRRWLRLGPPRPRQPNLLVVGATNQAAALDPALLRPGRFDRRLHVGLPGAAGRADVLGYYLERVPHEPVDVGALARATGGFSPAELRNVVNEALIFALGDGRSAVAARDLWQAKVTEESGLEATAAGSPRDREVTAVHEAGHALAASVLLGDRQVQMVSLARRGATLGMVHHTPLEERHTVARQELRRLIVVGLAGMAAEERCFGEPSNTAAVDLQRATLRAAEMLGLLGMGDSLVSYAAVGPDSADGNGDGSGHGAAGIFLCDPTNRRAVGRLLEACKQEAAGLLERHQPALQALTARLLEQGELSGDEVETLLRTHGVSRGTEADGAAGRTATPAR